MNTHTRRVLPIRHPVLFLFAVCCGCSSPRSGNPEEPSKEDMAVRSDPDSLSSEHNGSSAKTVQSTPSSRFSATIDGKAWNAEPGRQIVTPGGTAILKDFNVAARGDQTSGGDMLHLMFPDFSGTDTTIHLDKTDQAAGLMLVRADGQIFTASTFDLSARKSVADGWQLISGTFSATEKHALQQEPDVPITNGIFEGRVRMTDEALDAVKDPLRRISAELDGTHWDGKPAEFVSLIYLEDAQWTWDTQIIFQPEAVKRDGIAMMIIQLPYFNSNDTTFHLERYREKKGIRVLRSEKGVGHSYYSEAMDLRIDKQRDGDRVNLKAVFSGAFKCEDTAFPSIRITDGRLNSGWITPRKDALGVIKDLFAPK